MAALTRELLRHVDIESGGADGRGVRALDVGLQEGMMSLLLERRGASEVVGYDRALRTGRIDLVRKTLDAKFELIGDMKLQDFPGVLVRRGIKPFDVVIFAGVMYHMFDPLGGLAVVRGLVRDGGICLVETAVAFEDSHTMHFNNFGRFVSGGNPKDGGPVSLKGEGMNAGSLSCYWYITPRCLDYVLRFLRFEPLDVVHYGVAEDEVGKPAEGRIAVACRAVPQPIAESGDKYLHASQRPGLFAEFLWWDRVASDAPEVGYQGPRSDFRLNRAGTIDLHAACESMDPFPVEPDHTRLLLDARY
jgi:SAM-dependent methyltransferase